MAVKRARRDIGAMLAGSFWVGLVAIGFAVVGLSQRAIAQDGREFLGNHKDWVAWREAGSNGQVTCYMLSQPTKSRANKAGVSRGDIYIMVAHWPGRKIENQVTVVGGYPYKPGGQVKVTIDGRRYDLFTEGDAAWTYAPEEDQTLVNAMKKGISLSAVGISARGTTTTDSFSLRGFTAAHEAITSACS